MTEIEMTTEQAIEILQKSYHIGGPVKAVMRELQARQLGLEALREKAEREKGCECCNGDALKYCGIKNSFGSPSIVLFGGTAKPKPEEKFKCCPECGRKLGEGNG